MYGIPDSVKPLSAAEEQVMLAVWACRAPVDPAGHRRKAARKGLGTGDRAQLSLPAGGERAG